MDDIGSDHRANSVVVMEAIASVLAAGEAHPDLRRTARVRVFMQEVGDRIIKRRQALLGGLTSPP